MKNLLLHTAILLFICAGAANLKAAKNQRLKYDSLSCLQLEGLITNANEGQDGECTIELIALDESISTVVLKEGKKKFKFVLNKNSHYAIRVSKKGYISKLVSVNTEILSETAGIHVFEFETSLVKEAAMSKLNKDILDFPVAIIHYDYEMETFSYNKEYSAYIKKELHNVSAQQNKKSKETLAPMDSKVFASAR